MTIPENIQTFLKQPHYMTLGTLNKDNTIQMTVVWYEFVDGVFKVSTTGTRMKYKNMERNPDVTFLIYNTKNPYQYVQIKGSVSMTREDGHDLIDHLSDLYMGIKKYQGDPDRKEDRVVVTITPEKLQSMGL